MVEILSRFHIENLMDAEKTIANHQWQPLRPGVNIASFYQQSDNGISAALLHYQAGARVPMHQHTGYEHIFILHGSQQDANGVYTQGSLLIHAQGTQHEVFSADGCLALAIWQHPVEFIELKNEERS